MRMIQIIQLNISICNHKWEKSMLRIKNFRVEDLESRCVTDEAHPHFSWYVESDIQGTEIEYYELSVGKWKLRTSEQIQVAYQGDSLQPFTEYEAIITAHSKNGEMAQASLTFETGRMKEDWRGSWITDTKYRFTEKKVSPKPMTFRKVIKLPAKSEIETFEDCAGNGIISAKIYATALGIYDLYLDGQKLGDAYFSPGFTSYKNHLQYQTYDITKQIRDGINQQIIELTAVVSGGWAVGRFTYKSLNRIFAKKQAFLAELHIRYEDGTEKIVATDESWQVTMNGNFKSAEFYEGETYDATVDLSKTDWHNAGIVKPGIYPKIEADYGAPVMAHEVFKPISITKSATGELIYDLGQNFAGVISVKIKNAVQGQKIVFRHAEVLMDGELFTEPLRTAKQEAIYICNSGEQSYSPRMTYMGFRYVGVTGIAKEDLELTGLALYSDIRQHGIFKCSNELINKLQSNILWGTKSNFVDIPTDCPQRDERLGWTGDIALFSPTAVWNYDASRFLKKWLRDVQTDQVKGGGIPMTIPAVKVYWQMELVFTMADDHWGDACILVPWAVYLNTGDTEILRQMYPTMQKYIKACRFWANLLSIGKHRYVWHLLHHYGDWVAPGVSMWNCMFRGKYTATACLSNSSSVMESIATILGKKQDAQMYRKLHDNTADAYSSILMDENCKLKGKEEFQTGYVLPLYYGMLSGEKRKKAASNLAALVRRNDYHIGTGFPGTPYILFALADNGYEDEAFKMLLCDTCPSWLYEAKCGTTIWERWDALREDGTCNLGNDDGTGGMVSFNHYASGAVGNFLYRRIAGIEALEGGYKSFRIAPKIGGGLTSAEGIVTCAYGEIMSAWKIIEKDNKVFYIDVKVPVGTTCELQLPDGTSQYLVNGRYSFETIIN